MTQMTPNKLKGLIYEHGKTYGSVCQVIGINKDTFTRRIQSNGLDFKLSEIYKMAEYIPLSREDIQNVFFK